MKQLEKFGNANTRLGRCSLPDNEINSTNSFIVRTWKIFHTEASDQTDMAQYEKWCNWNDEC